MYVLDISVRAGRREVNRSEEQDGEPQPLPESDIDELERTMLRMKQVREQDKGLPLEERKKLADKLAEDLLRLL